MIAPIFWSRSLNYRFSGQDKDSVCGRGGWWPLLSGMLKYHPSAGSTSRFLDLHICASLTVGLCQGKTSTHTSPVPTFIPDSHAQESCF